MNDRRRKALHEWYVANRERILEQQRIYRETHKEEIKERRRKREFEKRYLQQPRTKRSRQELNHDFYMRHREEICKKARIRSYERRQQQYTIGNSPRIAE